MEESMSVKIKDFKGVVFSKTLTSVGNKKLVATTILDEMTTEFRVILSCGEIYTYFNIEDAVEGYNRIPSDTKGYFS